MTEQAAPPTTAKRPGTCLRRIFWTGMLLCAACCTFTFWIVPWSPFDASVGPLERALPADVGAAFRFDPQGLRDAPVLRRLLADEAFKEMLGDLDLPLSIEVDDDGSTAIDSVLEVLGRDAMLAERDGELLLAVRVTGFGHALFLASLSGVSQIAGVEFERGEDGIERISRHGELYGLLARSGDVLLVSRDEDLLTDASASAAGDADSLAANEEAATALRGNAPLGSRALLWAGRAWAEDAVDTWTSGPDGAVDTVTEVLPTGSHGPLSAELTLAPGGGSASVSVKWEYAPAVPALLAGAPRVRPERLADALTMARALAGTDDVQAVGSAALAVHAILERSALPDSVRRALADRAPALEGRVGFARMHAPRRSGFAGTQVDPATFAILPVHPAAGPTALDLLARELERRDGVRAERIGPQGVRFYEFRGTAVALLDDAIVISDSPHWLRGALDHPPAPQPPVTPPPDATILMLETAPAAFDDAPDALAWIKSARAELGLDDRSAELRLRLTLR